MIMQYKHADSSNTDYSEISKTPVKFSVYKASPWSSLIFFTRTFSLQLPIPGYEAMMSICEVAQAG